MSFLIEEIVGDIKDEFDESETDAIRCIGTDEYEIEGSTKLDDLNDVLGTEIESEDYDSIGGHMIELLDHLPKEDAGKAVEYYREYFAPKGIFENEVYPGIPEMLSRLVEAGFTLIVATSKPAVFAKQILEHFGLSDYFSFVGGSELDGTRKRKAEVIGYILETCEILSHKALPPQYHAFCPQSCWHLGA